MTVDSRDAAGPQLRHSFCRACINSCPTLVEVDAGRLVRVKGNPANPIFDGYSCIKGQQQPALHNHPDRLRHSLKRQPDGTYRRIPVADAMDEVAERLSQILDRHGPRAIASYVGSGAAGAPLADPFMGAIMSAIGSPMKFSPSTLDKPGKALALAMHGRWGAPLQGYHDPDVALLVGANPFKTYYGAAGGHPGHWLRDRQKAGMQLLVLDPRRSDVARRADLHVRPRPGHDPAILACLINVILGEGWHDDAFVSANARGVEALRAAVADFTPQFVAERAGVDPTDLVELARRFAAARRGYIACGVGPGFAKSSTLIEYLALVLETLCGHWLREGEVVARTTTLLASGPWRAQAYEPTPAYGIGETMRAGGLTQTVAGMPTGALADEMLYDGPGGVRALLSVGGNPVIAWPDQLKALAALRSLDLFVQFDPWLSASARAADYVIAPTMFYEVPGFTALTDFVIALPTYYGPAQAHGQYTAAIAAPPEDSEVIPEWEFLWGVAGRMGLQLNIKPMSLVPRLDDGGVVVDMARLPDAEELMAALVEGGRVSLDEVKQHPSGAVFPEPRQVVGPAEPGWQGRFDLANADILADLAAELADERAPGQADAQQYPFRLISIRTQHMNNTTVNDQATNRGRPNNPAYLHPADLERLGIARGDVVEIATPRAAILTLAEPDPDLLEGLVAMTFGYGDSPDRDDEFRQIGSPPGRILDGADLADPYVGMPRMGNIAVSVRPAG
ncbi:MAG: molybdopterin dinucleotide-binding protein [Actinomycetota bacterium]|nr:MAG: molybdopterin dinucleotide-binding protein [Actinomycetota bacterium]